MGLIIILSSFVSVIMKNLTFRLLDVFISFRFDLSILRTNALELAMPMSTGTCSCSFLVQIIDVSSCCNRNSWDKGIDCVTFRDITWSNSQSAKAINVAQSMQPKKGKQTFSGRSLSLEKYLNHFYMTYNK